MKKIFALFAFFKTELSFVLMFFLGFCLFYFFIDSINQRSIAPQSVVKLNGFEQVWMKSNVETAISAHENHLLIADSGRIFVPSNNDFGGTRIVILNSLDGKKIGSTPVIEHLTSYAVEGSSIYWGSREDCIKYDLEKKKRLWKKRFPDTKGAENLQIVNGELQFYGYPSRFFRISSIDGSEIQIVDEQKDLKYGSYRYENGIYYVENANALQAIDKNEKIFWKTDMFEFDMDRWPEFSKGIIYSVHDGILYAFDRRTGKTLWRTSTTINIKSNIVEGNQRVFFTTVENRLYAVSTKNGNVLALSHFHPIMTWKIL